MSKKYLPEYTQSKALVIGINKYSSVSPLQFAVSDADAISKILIEKFNFGEDDVILLTDSHANRNNIMHEYLSFAQDSIDENGRLIIYFAGHGFTKTAARGEIGYLVPFDGNINDLSTLIRWDEITKNSELIPAKHILYFMDACYGGTALMRSATTPGATRFIKDMLTRYSRQVITSGKADEPVSDSGGPLPNHSIFTGNLLEALSGKASDSMGILTANGVMAYVYEHVGKDQESIQTPHYGHFQGDGDFLFTTDILEKIDQNLEEEHDLLYTIPVPSKDNEQIQVPSNNEEIKEYLTDSKYKIKLFDKVTELTRNCVNEINNDNFPINAIANVDEILKRLKLYEDLCSELTDAAIIFGYWANQNHINTVLLPVKRMLERIKQESGPTVWLSLQWYPIHLYTYALGIASVAATNYDILHKLLCVPTIDKYNEYRQKKLLISLFEDPSYLHDAFKMLPGLERKHVPRSEYMYKVLQPKLDETIFLGMDYDSCFDKFELLLALEFAHIQLKENNYIWGPPGRFAWKNRNPDSPLKHLIAEEKKENEDWGPLQCGFFDKSSDRFLLIAKDYEQQILKAFPGF